MDQRDIHAAKRAHVNMMTDTVIANLEPDMLRGLMRTILTTQPSITPLFESLARKALLKKSKPHIEQLFLTSRDKIAMTSAFEALRRQVLAMIGCGLVFQSLPLIIPVVEQACSQFPHGARIEMEELESALVSIDGVIVQAVTAVEKSLLSDSGHRDLSEEESGPLTLLLESLIRGKGRVGKNSEYPLQRSLLAVSRILGCSIEVDDDRRQKTTWSDRCSSPVSTDVETSQINDISLPRLFSGLWQLSSPSWGNASQSEMARHFAAYVNRGFTAFDMADHYGDAEIIFGRLRKSHPHPERIFGATKFCVFNRIQVTAEVIAANVTERCDRVGVDAIDLLQFHWQHYDDDQYLYALRLLQQDPRIRLIGLCNFDTKHLQRVVENNIDVVTNQVQFSLIDARPHFAMADVCIRHKIKLLTYGTLCGGFLAERWLNEPEPQLFDVDMTPSQRKYFEMIQAWGDWSLFQELLQTLLVIAEKFQVSISNVAVRWVLDFEYVGAVIIGARMGVSEHSEDNLKSYGWRLDEVDQQAIEAVLKKSRRREVWESMGDCGSEYR